MSYMADYNEAVRQLQDNGYIEDNLLNRLSHEDVVKAQEEASNRA